MNQAKATPGPWRIGDAGHTVFGPPNGNPSPETGCAVSRDARDFAACLILGICAWVLVWLTLCMFTK